MRDGNGFVNISLAYHLVRDPSRPDEERRGLLGRLSVVVRDYAGVGLEEEPNVRVADSLAENLRVDTGFQRAGRIRVAQIVEGDPREPRDGGPIDRYRLVGILGFATGLVPRVASDDPRAVMHSDLAMLP